MATVDERAVYTDREALLALIALVVEESLRRFRQVVAATRFRVQSLAQSAAPRPLTRSFLRQNRRATTFAAGILADLADWLSPLVWQRIGLTEQAEGLGREQSEKRLRDTGLTAFFRPLAPTPAQVSAAFDESALTRLFQSLPADGAARAKAALFAGVAKGLPTDALASEVANALAVPLARATAITRTETIRAFREAQGAVFEANADNLRGWVWIAHRSTACIACLVKHGSEHPVTETLSDHPNGCCQMLPLPDKALRLPDPRVSDVRLWFDQLSADEQAKRLPHVLVEPYRDGRVAWGDLATEHTHPVWGQSVQPTPAKDLLP